jgi:CBS domain containing-hemolysin-like protein
VDAVLELVPWLVAMFVLLCFSAFFSASEAALFCLRWADRRALASGTRGQRIAERLLHDPDRLLSAVLFWNLLVNMVYFAIVSVLGGRLERDLHISPAGLAIYTTGAILVVIFFSEMLPKSLAVLAARRLAGLVGLPLATAVRIVDPVMPALRVVNLLSRRLIWPGLTEEPYLEAEDLARAVELSHVDANLAKQEQTVLQRVVAMSEVHVEEWMRPRSQCRTFRSPVRIQDLADDMPPTGYLLIAEPERDEIIAALDLWKLSYLDPTHLEASATPVVYVPWCATVSHTFEQMDQLDADVAAVVNEHGETIGVLTMRDLMDALLTVRHERGERLLHRTPIQQIAEGVWHVAGVTNISRLKRKFGVELPETRHVTIGGVVQEELERLAEAGDRCAWGPFQLEVLRADSQRDILVELRLRDEEVKP